MKASLKRLSSFQIIILGFVFVILVGTALLMLPISTISRKSTSLMDALFTATSAVCVTGLIVHDTATYWSSFGQAVILMLIQIGGLGVVSVATLVPLLSGRKINLRQRSTMQEAVSAPQVGGIVKFTSFIFKMTLFMELLGFVIMAPVFCSEFGFFKGIWYALFHSISAFCNAGFDLMGIKEPCSSLTSFNTNPLINIVIMMLIISGGLGFIVWDDIKTNKFHFKKYRVQSKIVLVTTAVLIVIPAFYMYFCEYSREVYDSMSPFGRVISSIFQSVTTRTAGFNTTDLSLMSGGTLCLMIFLMIVGGSTGSTAGGMKTTTIAVVASSAISVFKRSGETHFFKRRIAEDIVRKASAISFMYITLFVTGGIIISNVEDLPIINCLFETASAIGTVGLSTGITADLGYVSHIILILLMFFGRVGGLTFIFGTILPKFSGQSKLPLENINIG